MKKISYDLRADLHTMWKIQRGRILKLYREERRRWREADPKEKRLDTKLSDEIELSMKLLEAMFIVSGKAYEGAFGEHEESVSSPSERIAQNRMREEIFSILRKNPGL